MLADEGRPANRPGWPFAAGGDPISNLRRCSTGWAAVSRLARSIFMGRARPEDEDAAPCPDGAGVV